MTAVLIQSRLLLKSLMLEAKFMKEWSDILLDFNNIVGADKAQTARKKHHLCSTPGINPYRYL